MNSMEISFKEAISDSDRDEWKDAIYTEIKCLIKNDTWKIVDKPAGTKVLGCRTVLRNKYSSDGSVERRKARVVAQSFTQRPGVDYNDTFAPVARLSSFMVTALSAEYNMCIEQLDVISAFLNGEIDTEIYMKQPELLEETLQRIIQEKQDIQLITKATTMIKDLTDRDKVCKLNKALYGLWQTGRQWNAKLHEAIINLGLKAANADPCVYIDQQGNELTILLVYVDDILLASTNRGRVKQIKEKLVRRFALRDLGQAKFCLGIEIQRVHNKIILSHTSYIRDVLQRFNMNTCNVISTPMSVAGKVNFSSNDLRNERNDLRKIK